MGTMQCVSQCRNEHIWRAMGLHVRREQVQGMPWDEITHSVTPYDTHTHTHCSHHTGGLTPHYMAPHEVLPRQDTSLAIVGIHCKVQHRTVAPADTINSGTISE